MEDPTLDEEPSNVNSTLVKTSIFYNYMNMSLFYVDNNPFLHVLTLVDYSLHLNTFDISETFQISGTLPFHTLNLDEYFATNYQIKKNKYS